MNDTLDFAAQTVEDALTQTTTSSMDYDMALLSYFDWSTVVELLLCLIVPVAIVFIVLYVRHLNKKQEYKLMETAIVSGANPDEVRRLLDARSPKSEKRRKTTKASLLRRLVWGALLTIGGLAWAIIEIAVEIDTTDLVIASFAFALGVGLLLSWFSGRKILAHDIEMENAEEAKPEREAEVKSSSDAKTAAEDSAESGNSAE